ncbi:extracellular solute-binding protein [Paenibacillus cymbidii]|uniref:extracellular solute-binding protein n=1 Tax=Paenibacillus cymbidii TaxID=1639034 RepID=UPI0010819BD6|nr:extracellular solute-binding protein [Paenibacillus cymbidii]
MKRRRHQLILALGASSLLALPLAGCAGKEKPQGSNASASPAASASASASPLSISMQTLIWGTPPDVDKSPFYQELQKRTNTKLKIEFVTSPAFTEKMNLALASKTLADITVVKTLTEANIVNAINQGAFYDLGPFLGDLSKYPNLAKLPANLWSDASINGKTYGIPNATGVISDALLIRKDWLTELNLQVPTTVDELKSVLEAFKAKKTGVTPATASTTYPIGTAMSAFGTQNPVIEGDRMVLKELTPGFRDYLLYMRDLYGKQLLPTEYSVLKAGQDTEMFQQGKAGVLNRPIHEAWTIQKELKKTAPQGEVLVLPPLKGPNGYVQNARDSFYGAFMIPSSVPKDKVEKLLRYLDQSASPELNDLRKYGIEGIHHKKNADGSIAVDSEALNRDVGGTVYVLVNSYNKYNEIEKFADMPADFMKELKQKTDSYFQNAKPDPFTGLVSDTYAKRSGDLFKDMGTNVTKVIIGKSSIEEWDGYVKQLQNDATVQTMMREYADQYKLKNPAK